MRYYWNAASKWSAGALLIFLLFPFQSCKQYDYHSPSPGIIEVRLKTVSQEIAFHPSNNFGLRVANVDAIRDDYSRVAVFADLRAIERKTSTYNTLDTLARDSSLIIGQSFAPPGEFIGITLRVTPSEVVVRDGYRIITLEKPDEYDQCCSILFFARPFEIRENMTTRITLTIDLDSSLVKRANSYYFNPYYYISSVELQ